MSVRDTLEGAIAWTGARPLGDTPEDGEMTACLAHFQNMLLALPSLGMAGQLTDVIITADYEAGENERIFNTDLDDGDEPFQVTLPREIEDDAVESGSRPPRHGAVVKIAGDDGQTFVYIAYLGAWVTLQGLALNDDQPLGAEFEEALQTMLGARICRPVFQRSPSAELMAMAEMGRRLIRQRFRQVIPVQVDPVLVRRYGRGVALAI